MEKTNTIITIGREFGSAGREIGYKVAKDFGIKLYDKEMLGRAAKESGICEELFEAQQLLIFSGYGYIFPGIFRRELYRYADQPQSISGTV